MNADVAWYRTRIGGLVRCCIQSLWDTEFEQAPKDGDTVKCNYCPEKMIFHDGAWEWDHPETVGLT